MFKKILALILSLILIPISAIAADVLGSQPVRSITSSTILTTSNLSNGGVYTSPWQDSSTGQKFLVVTAYTHSGQSGSFVVQFTEDQAQSPTTSQTFNVTGGTVFTSVSIPIVNRYYRVVYTNGGTTQTTFELVITAAQSSLIQNNQDSSGNIGVYLGGISGYGSTYSNPLYVLNGVGPLEYAYTNSATTTTSTIVVKSGAGVIVQLINSCSTCSSAPTAAFGVYCGTSTTLASDVIVFSAQLGAGATLPLNWYCSTGIVVTSTTTSDAATEITSPINISYY